MKVPPWRTSLLRPLIWKCLAEITVFAAVSLVLCNKISHLAPRSAVKETICHGGICETFDDLPEKREQITSAVRCERASSAGWGRNLNVRLVIKSPCMHRSLSRVTTSNNWLLWQSCPASSRPFALAQRAAPRRPWPQWQFVVVYKVIPTIGGSIFITPIPWLCLSLAVCYSVGCCHKVREYLLSSSFCLQKWPTKS